MITVKLLGGLGNQMFQYALGRHLSIKNKESLFLDLTELLKRDNINHTPREFALDVFNINYAGKILPGDTKTLKERLTYKYLTRKVNESGHNFNPEILALKKNVYLNGYWQNEKYFDDIETIVRQDFTLKADMPIENKSAMNNISSANSVSVHFRLGDYVSNPAARNFHGVLEPSYYKRAMAKICELVPSPHFFIFSDDVNWVKENVVFEHEHTFINDEAIPAADMHLMALCKHHIIANSSFSWWGAWLDPNPEKLVIGPQKWFTNNHAEILPDQWIQI